MELLPSLASQQTPSTAKMNARSLVEQNMATCCSCTRQFKYLAAFVLCLALTILSWCAVARYSATQQMTFAVSKTNLTVGPHETFAVNKTNSTVGPHKEKPGKARILEMVNFSPNQTKHRYLIYTCRLTQYCGGLSDRIRGITYAFLLAVITRRKFGIHMELPTCELSSMLEVNHLDWRVNITFLDEANLTSQVYNRVNKVSIRKEFMTFDFNTYFHKDIVYYTSNQLLFRELFANPHHVTDLRWLTSVPRVEIIRLIINTLFKLAPSLQSEVDNITAQAHHRHDGGMLVAAQLRCGRNPSMPKDTQVRLVPEDLQIIWKFLKSYLTNPAASFFISSDSEKVVREAKLIFRERLLESSGPIVHVAYPMNSDDVCSGMRRVLVDIHVLAASDVLLVTHSGIGDLASHLRGFDKGGLFCFRSHDARVTALSLTVHWLCR